MHPSRLMAVAVIAGIALALPAQAATKAKRPTPKPVCNLLVDAKGDEGILASSGPAVLPDASLDILSADIVADTARLTAVIRVAKLAETSQESPLGRQWSLAWNMQGRSFGMLVTTSPYGGTTLGLEGTVVLDTAKNEIRMSAVWPSFYVKIPPAAGDVIGNIRASASSVIGFPSQAQPAVGAAMAFQQQDAATSTRTYAIGTPSCLPLGP